MKVYGYKQNKCKEEINIGIFSTTEQKVGIWKDGKPLYRKVVDTIAPSTPTDGTYVHNTTDIENNIETGIIEFAYLIDQYSTNVPLPYTTHEGYHIKANIGYYEKNKVLNIYNGATDYNDCRVRASILYTKITD